MSDIKIPDVGKKPWGPDDQQGALNRMDAKSPAAVVSHIDGTRVYDLSVDYFLGMPSFLPTSHTAHLPPPPPPPPPQKKKKNPPQASDWIFAVDIRVT